MVPAWILSLFAPRSQLAGAHVVIDDRALIIQSGRTITGANILSGRQNQCGPEMDPLGGHIH